MAPTHREVVLDALNFRRPPYVPWSCWFTHDAWAKLAAHYGNDGAVAAALDNHILGLGQAEAMVDIGNRRVRDRWQVVWNRSIDADIGMIEGRVLSGPNLAGWQPPDPENPAITAGIDERIAAQPDCFRLFGIGFSLYERAWTLRGMEELMADMIDHPEFVDALLERICDWNLAVVRNALRHDLDAVYFGDDWGAQHGLQMGPKRWRRFILPHLKRMYGMVRAAGKAVFIHSCGDVDEVFDDLVDAGLTCFNPFQPEVMDVASLFHAYRGRLAFHGGLSTQQTLPHGTPDQVRAETDRLLALGSDGGYIFAPAHAVEGDVPLANMLAFIDRLHAQPGWRAGPATTAATGP